MNSLLAIMFYIAISGIVASTIALLAYALLCVALDIEKLKKDKTS